MSRIYIVSFKMPQVKEKSLLFKLDCENANEHFDFDYELKTLNLKSSYKFKSEAESFFKHILGEMNQNLVAREMTGSFDCKVELKYQQSQDKGILGISFSDILKAAYYEGVEIHEFSDSEVIEDFVEMALDIQKQYLDNNIFDL